jgi:hypothetical protein
MNYGDEQVQMTIGVPWYRQEQWQRLLQISADAAELEETYEGWLPYATQRCEELCRAGLDIRKVDVDVEELFNWCRRRGVRVNSASRADFVSYKVHKEQRHRKVDG